MLHILCWQSADENMLSSLWGVKIWDAIQYEFDNAVKPRNRSGSVNSGLWQLDIPFLLSGGVRCSQTEEMSVIEVKRDIQNNL